MANIKIHWQKMQYHKVTAISVTLTSWTWGTATFTPATGTSYTLSSLPIGSKIVKASSTLYNITDSSNNLLWSITVTASSWYDIVWVYISRWWTSIDITTTPVELQNWDTIEPLFDEIPVTLYLSTDSWSKASWWAYWSDWKNEIVSLQFVPNRWELQYIWDTYEKLDHIYSFSTNSYTADTIYLHVDENAYWLSEIDYKDADWYTNTINLKNWNLRIPVDYNWWYVRAGENMVAIIKWWSSCNVVKLQDMSIQSTEFTQTIESYVLNNYSFIKQIQQWRAPNNWNMIYTFYDGIFHMVCSVVVTYLDRNWQLSNTEIVAAFSTDRKWNAYCSIYDREWHLYDTYWVRERPSNLVYIPNIWADVYQSNTSRALDTWVNDWNCWDTCWLIQTIYNLATNK